MLCSPRTLGRFLGSLLFAVALAAPEVVLAGDDKAGESGVDLDALRKRLESGKEADVLAALEEIGNAKDPAAAILVNELLARGATVKILVEACRTAGKLKQPSSSAPLAPYVQHRESDVRLQAARALLRTKGPPAVRALRRGLRSSDAAVRGISATGLGALGAAEAVPDLFIALDHSVSEAAASIGQLCTPEQCDRFVEKTGKIPFDIMSTGFDQIFFRPPKEVPDAQKLRIVEKLAALGTREVSRYLADVGDRWPKDWSPKVKEALEQAGQAARGK